MLRVTRKPSEKRFLPVTLQTAHETKPEQSKPPSVGPLQLPPPHLSDTCQSKVLRSGIKELTIRAFSLFRFLQNLLTKIATVVRLIILWNTALECTRSRTKAGQCFGARATLVFPATVTRPASL